MKFLQNKVSHSDLIRNVRGEEGTVTQDGRTPLRISNAMVLATAICVDVD